MSRLQQIDQLIFFGLLFSAVICTIGIILQGYLLFRKNTTDAERKQSKKVFFVLIAALAVISFVYFSGVIES